MSVQIRIADPHDLGASEALREVAHALQRDRIEVNAHEAPAPPGTRGAITTALNLGTLTLSALTVLVSILKFRFDGQSKYTVTISRGKITVTLAQITRQEAIDFLRDSDPGTASYIEIKSNE